MASRCFSQRKKEKNVKTTDAKSSDRLCAVRERWLCWEENTNSPLMGRDYLVAEAKTTHREWWGEETFVCGGRIAVRGARRKKNEIGPNDNNNHSGWLYFYVMPQGDNCLYEEREEISIRMEALCD